MFSLAVGQCFKGGLCVVHSFSGKVDVPCVAVIKTKPAEAALYCTAPLQVRPMTPKWYHDSNPWLLNLVFTRKFPIHLLNSGFSHLQAKLSYPDLSLKPGWHLVALNQFGNLFELVQHQLSSTIGWVELSQALVAISDRFWHRKILCWCVFCVRGWLMGCWCLWDVREREREWLCVWLGKESWKSVG